MKSVKPVFANFGVGIGLRHPHLHLFLDPATRPREINWVEVIHENFMKGPRLQNTGGLKNLMKVREHYPVALHGVSMSLGSSTGLDPLYLKNLKELVDQVQPIVVSDHLCWTRVGKRQTHDLNPIPYTSAHVQFIADQILRAQDVLKRRMLIENVSTYLTHTASEMSEEQFLSEIVKRADCGLLLDLNNVYVSATNHQFDARAFLQGLPHERVGQLHLAGHSNVDGFLIDTHDSAICEAVWELFNWYGKTYGHPSPMIERDGKIPAWTEMLTEVNRMRIDFVPNAEITKRVPEGQWSSSRTLSGNGALQNSEADQNAWVDSLYDEYRVTGIVSDEKRSARDRFGVYEEAFWLRLNECLVQDFPELLAKLGEETFDELVYEVLNAHPSESYSLEELSLRFVEGLRMMNHPELSLAEREWNRRLAFLLRGQLGPSTVESQFDQLAHESPDEFNRICLVLHPSLQVLSDQRMVFWYDTKAKEKSFSQSDWPAIVALTSHRPLSEWEGISGLNPENIQSWTQEGMISGYQKKFS